jgi:hypothetical protein
MEGSRLSQNHMNIISDPPTLESAVAIDVEIRGCRGGGVLEGFGRIRCLHLPHPTIKRDFKLSKGKLDFEFN